MPENEQDPIPPQPPDQPLPYPPANYPPPNSQWPPPQPHGTPPVEMPPASPVNGQIVLILGLSSLASTVLCGLFCGIMALLGGGLGVAAWIMGNQALATLDRVGDPLLQRGMVNAGRICGIVSVALAILGGIVTAGFVIYSMMTNPHHG